MPTTSNSETSLADRLKVWPYSWHEVGLLVGAYAAMVAVWTAVGFLITEVIEPAIGGAEQDFASWLEDQRTDTLNDMATWASIPSDTFVKIGLVALMAIVFPAVFRRWHDWAFLVTALVLEVSVYGTSSWIVGRPRPDVERLSEAPTQSWPSGHVAAALTFYVGLALIADWRTNDRRIVVSARIVAVLVVIAMVISRLYLGMHFVSDVIGGIALGSTALWVANYILRRGVQEIDENDPEDELAQDLTALEVTNG